MTDYRKMTRKQRKMERKKRKLAKKLAKKLRRQQKIGFLKLSDTECNRHHRLPQSKGGTWADSNISVISKRKHAAWHCLFFNYDAYAIACIINKIFLDPAYKLEVKEVCHE